MCVCARVFMYPGVQLWQFYLWEFMSLLHLIATALRGMVIAVRKIAIADNPPTLGDKYTYNTFLTAQIQRQNVSRFLFPDFVFLNTVYHPGIHPWKRWWNHCVLKQPSVLWLWSMPLSPESTPCIRVERRGQDTVQPDWVWPVWLRSQGNVSWKVQNLWLPFKSVKLPFKKQTVRSANHDQCVQARLY